jgi:tRNA threonylcarbamoyl adenosine modification protein YeaZ
MMLAFELSSRAGSVVLHDGTRVVAGESWDDPAARHPAFFSAVPRIMNEADVTWNHLRGIAAGRGPGAFSGVRVGLMAAQAFARPSLTPVLAVSSGEALALEVVQESGPHPVVVAGDARRGSIWFAQFHRSEEGVRKQRDWTLVPAAEFTGQLPDGAWVVSPTGPACPRFAARAMPDCTGSKATATPPPPAWQSGPGANWRREPPAKRLNRSICTRQFDKTAGMPYY